MARDRRTGWGPGKAFQSMGPIHTKSALRRVARELRKRGHTDAADFAERFPDAVLARPKMQEEMLGLLPAGFWPPRANPRRRATRRTIRRRLPTARANPRRSVRRNPSESAAWRAVKAIGQRFARFKEVGPGRPAMLNTDGQALVDLANTMLAQLARGMHENPALAVVGANPPVGEVVEIRYYRRGGKHPGWYKHKFAPRAMMTALSDGSLRIR